MGHIKSRSSTSYVTKKQGKASGSSQVTRLCGGAFTSGVQHPQVPTRRYSIHLAAGKALRGDSGISFVASKIQFGLACLLQCS